MGERKALGKGLGALLGDKAAGPSPASPPDPPPSTGSSGSSAGDTDIRSVSVDAIRPNPDQPRERIDPEALRELADSIKLDGVIQPIVVQPDGDAFLLIAGERRWRAAQMAGLSELPAVVYHLADPSDSLRLALVENIQRRDLNPLEEARAYQELIQRCGLTQEQLAQQVSRSRSTVTNMLRLLQLPEEIQRQLASGGLSMGHARALLAADRRDTQLKLAQRIAAEGLSVRQVERLLSTPRQSKRTSRSDPAASSTQQDPYYESLEAALRVALGTKVAVRPTGETSGRIVIEYYSYEELEGILTRFGIHASE